MPRSHEYVIRDASVLPLWRRSTYSGGNSGDCLEVNDSACPARIPVRDSKHPTGPAVLFGAVAWAAFVGAVRADSLR